MLRSIRSRLSFANVTAMLALTVAVGGGVAVANHPLGANTIISVDVIDGEVKEPDVAPSAITGGKVRDDSLGSSDVTGIWSPDVLDNGLIGADIDESTLQIRLAYPSVGTAINSTSAKGAVATCPADKPQVVGGGYSLQGNVGDAADDVVVWTNEPRNFLDVPDSWRVEAAENDPTGATWGVRAFAICVN